MTKKTTPATKAGTAKTKTKTKTAKAAKPAAPAVKKASTAKAKTKAARPATKATRGAASAKTGPASLTRASVSPTTRAMFDLLADEGTHAKEDVLYAGFAAALAADYRKCIDEGRRARRGRPATLQEYAHSGARHFARNNLMIAERNKRILTVGRNDAARSRMPAALARDWASQSRADAQPRLREPISVQPFGQITYYAGMTEWEGWAYAPLVARDVAHVRPTTPVSLHRLQQAFPGWQIEEGPDGLVSISAHPGAPVKEVVTQWFADHGVHHDGVRDAKNVRRRDLTQLLPSFLEDLVRKSVPFARGLVASRYAASMQRLVGDHDDIDGYVALWILELAQSFDATLGRPFGTWITSQLPRKVQDLNRASHGRTASDAEMKHAKARAEFEGRHGRSPSSSELRELLGLSADEMNAKRRHLATLAGLRSAAPLDQGPDAPEIHVVDHDADPERDALDRERAQQISLALLAASGKHDPNRGRPAMTRPLGFLVTYLMMWDDWVKGDLIALAGCADRKVTEEVDAVQAELATTLAELRYL